ncbi:hypothetical protein GGI43DRAFT_383964 [Trichoderma evansii]
MRPVHRVYMETVLGYDGRFDDAIEEYVATIFIPKNSPLHLLTIVMDKVKRTATVSIRNNTSKPIFAVSLLHKYSDVYKNRKEWAAIAAGDVTNETLKVEYNTGFFTTGRDCGKSLGSAKT